jgi:DNA-directed RNA polymerase sigma subunit (sigma70/sigma32)
VTEEPEEVVRFLDAVRALEEIEDDAACAQAITKILKDWPDSHARLREIRQQRVQNLKAQGKTWQEIGDALGIHFTRAQQIAKGLRGNKRPTKAESDAAEQAGSPGGVNP